MDVVELAEGGGWLVDREPALLSIREVIESVADMVRPIADDKGLDVRIRTPAVDLRVGHRSALSRVLLNLSANALRFTDEGDVEISATPSPNGWLRFSVRDTGPGIPAGAIEHLARPFRVSRARSEYLLCETGLGLSICQKLLQAMDSQLEVETEPGLGTRFHFELYLPATSAPPALACEIVRVPSPMGPAASSSRG
jgi:signal transduction histidine kinase